MRRSLAVLSLLVLSQPTMGMKPDNPSFSKSRYFFKNPTSLFPSGEATLNTLLRKQTLNSQQNWALVSTLSYRRWLDREDLIFPDQVKQLSDGAFEAMTLQPTRLFTTRNQKAISVAVLSAGEKVRISQLQGPWAYADFRGTQYLILTDQLILPTDFAAQVQLLNGEYKPFNYRKGDRIFLKDQDYPISISQMKSFVSLPSVAILKRDIELEKQEKLSRLFRGQRLLVEKLQTLNWTQSFIEGHGLVWWRAEDKAKEEETPWITTLELSKKNIHDFARAQDGEPIALASSSGVYLTQNGKNWKQLLEFGDQNWPLAVGKDKKLFVGSRYSKNLGEDFVDFINWEDVAFQTQVTLGRPPQFLLLRKTRIDEKKQKVILEIDTGWKVISFQLDYPESNKKIL